MLRRSVQLGPFYMRPATLYRHCSASSSSNSNVSETRTSAESFAHSVQVKVCGRFSRHPILLRPWFLRYIPKGGLPMNIDYIDTMPDADPDTVKTILILHNTPGSYYDFFKFLATFGSSYRVIVPNFPEITYTQQTGNFWHSAEERSEYIADFLRHINVSRVDCLVAHSMAAYTASFLWLYANWDIYFKLGSICLISPVGMFKFRWKEKLRQSFVTNMCRSLALRKLIPQRYLVPKSQRKNRFHTGSVLGSVEVLAWKTLTMKLSDYENYPYRLKVLADSKIPTLFAFSSNDSRYLSSIYFDQLFELGAETDNFDIYEQYHNELIQASTGESWLKVVDFRSAGHYMFNTHPEIVHSYIAELLNRPKLADKLLESASAAQS